MDKNLDSDRSITKWIEQVRQGDEAAASRLWQEYFQTLCQNARRMLNSRVRRADEEDVVVNVFDSFFRGVRNDRFPDLRDRHHLWRLLLELTRRKAIRELEFEGRQKRGNGKIRGESVFWNPDLPQNQGIAEFAFDDSPTPDFAALLVDQLEVLMNSLPDPVLVTIAEMRLSGYANCEIAREISVTLRTVERKLRLIRDIWQNTLGNPDG